eukprot:858553-Pleurochrysis_carterae.AAC.1
MLRRRTDWTIFWRQLSLCLPGAKSVRLAVDGDGSARSSDGGKGDNGELARSGDGGGSDGGGGGGGDSGSQRGGSVGSQSMYADDEDSSGLPAPLELAFYSPLPALVKSRWAAWLRRWRAMLGHSDDDIEAARRTMQLASPK